MSTPINFLTPEQCAEQFEMYAKCHKDPVAIHQLTFCAKFLRDNCIQPEPMFTQSYYEGYRASGGDKNALPIKEAYRKHIKKLKNR